MRDSTYYLELDAPLERPVFTACNDQKALVFAAARRDEQQRLFPYMRIAGTLWRYAAVCSVKGPLPSESILVGPVLPPTCAASG